MKASIAFKPKSKIMAQTENNLQIATGELSAAEYAKAASTHLLYLIKSAFGALHDPDDFDTREIESMRFTLDLALRLQREEERLAQLPRDT